MNALAQWRCVNAVGAHPCACDGGMCGRRLCCQRRDAANAGSTRCGLVGRSRRLRFAAAARPAIDDTQARISCSALLASCSCSLDRLCLGRPLAERARGAAAAAVGLHAACLIGPAVMQPLAASRGHAHLLLVPRIGAHSSRARLPGRLLDAPGDNVSAISWRGEECAFGACQNARGRSRDGVCERADRRAGLHHLPPVLGRA